MSKVLFAMAIFALGIVSAAPKTLHMSLATAAWVGGNELQPGDYKVEMQGDKAIISAKKSHVEVPAKMETGDKKYSTTSVVIASADSRPTISEIQFGGTTTRIVFSAPPTGE